MRNNMKTKDLSLMIISILIGGVIGYIVFYSAYGKNSYSRIVSTQIDTVYQVIESKPIIIERMNPVLVYKTDTLIQTMPFTAIIDTTIMTDTISARYDFPENEFSLAVRKTADTLAIYSIHIATESKKGKYENVTYAIGGALIGIIIGNLTNKK
jgi:hypothetical protein